MCHVEVANNSLSIKKEIIKHEEKITHNVGSFSDLENDKLLNLIEKYGFDRQKIPQEMPERKRSAILGKLRFIELNPDTLNGKFKNVLEKF